MKSCDRRRRQLNSGWFFLIFKIINLVLRKLKEKRQDGLEAIQKIKSKKFKILIKLIKKFKAIKERLLEVDQRILQEEQERKMAKVKQIELESSRSTKEQQLRAV